jgi:3-phytase
VTVIDSGSGTVTGARNLRVALLSICSLLALAACTTSRPFLGPYHLEHRVPPAAETTPVASGADAADDPAIWIHPVDPGASLIVATDKQSGLYVYGLDGAERQYLPIGRTNNVDLRTAPWGDDDLTLVAASSRRPSELLLLTLDHHSGELKLRERHRVRLGEPYGICLYQDTNQQPYVFLNDTDGTYVQYAVDPDYGISEVRHWQLRSRPEGCVADDDEGTLYIGEEDRGIWQMSANPEDPARLDLLDAVGRGHLFADVEGLALYHGPRKLLIASSQGNNSFAVYDLSTSEHLLSFHVAGDAVVDDVSDTDGVEVTAVSLPGYPQGILVVQDGYNKKPSANQNFKLVSWGDVLEIIEQQ